MYSISLTGEIKSNFSWRVEILTLPFPPKNVIFTPFSHVFPIISTGSTSESTPRFNRFFEPQQLALTGNSYNFDVKIIDFARNRISIFPLHRETLVSEIPVRLSPYTVLLNYFLHTINFIHTFPPNVLITHSPPYIPALLMVDHAVSFNH